jgi:hypothetical protein
MSTMTVENQRRYIADYRAIIADLKRQKPIKSYDLLYIRDLEKSIEEREAWIREQGGRKDA